MTDPDFSVSELGHLMLKADHFWRVLAVSLFAVILGGCASSFTDIAPGTVKEVVGSAVIETESVAIPAALDIAPPSDDYQVGPGDVLFVNVQGRPELGSSLVSSAQALKGNRVDGEGRIHLPLVGAVPIAGLTVAEVENCLVGVFSDYLQSPWVVVEVAEYRSQPLYLIGQFRKAGTFYMERPMTLLQGVSAGDGLLDTASLRSARLIRGKQTMPVDLLALFAGGDLSQNVWLQSGDAIYVPDDKNQNVYVLGAVGKPGPVVMPNGILTLGQALAAANFNDVRGHSGYVRIIRSHSQTRGELLVVDYDAVLRGRALPFLLMKGDVIYVPRTRIGNWNEAINEILPSLRLISATLEPFVQLKFLNN